MNKKTTAIDILRKNLCKTADAISSKAYGASINDDIKRKLPQLAAFTHGSEWVAAVVEVLRVTLLKPVRELQAAMTRELGTISTALRVFPPTCNDCKYNGGRPR